jgi:hypothetical protein
MEQEHITKDENALSSLVNADGWCIVSSYIRLGPQTNVEDTYHVILDHPCASSFSRPPTGQECEIYCNILHMGVERWGSSDEMAMRCEVRM